MTLAFANRVGVIGIGAVLGALVFGSEVAKARGQALDGAALLERAKHAVAQKPSAKSLRTVLITGSVVRPSDSAQKGQPAALTIKILLPTYYMREEVRGPAARRSGFANDRLLTGLTNAAARVSIRASTSILQLTAERHELARLMIGMFADTHGTLRVRAEVSSNGPHELWISGDTGFVGSLELDPKAATPVRFVDGDPRRLLMPPVQDVPKPGAPGVQSLSFTSRRNVGGFWLPHSLRRRSGERVVEELTFDAIVLNSPLTAADFAAVK